MSRKPSTKIDVKDQATCGCGAVSVEISGRVWTMFHCACTACQKVTGSGHSSIAVVAADAVTVSGETASFSRPADSGATLTRHFCPTCGVPVFAKTTSRDDITLVPAGLFGKGDWFSAGHVLFARSKLDWDHFDPDLPQVADYRD